MEKFLSFVKAHKALSLGLLLLIPAAFFGVRFTLWLSRFMTGERMAAARHFFESLGTWGYVALAAFHMSRVLLPFLPAEPFELLAGVMYGWLGGLLNCMIGIFFGSLLVFLLARRYGDRLVKKMLPESQLSRYTYLKSWPALDKITFLIFFLPGTPKDLYTYVVGLTNMRLTRFLLYVLVARIPSVVTSTLAGAVVMDGNLLLGVGIYAATAVLAVSGLIFHERVLKKKIR